MECVWCFSHDETEIVDLGEKDHRDKVQFSLHQIKGTYYLHNLILLMLTLIFWLKQLRSDFSTAKLLFIFLSILYLLEEVIMYSPYIRNRNVYFTSLREEHLHELFEAIL